MFVRQTTSMPSDLFASCQLGSPSVGMMSYTKRKFIRKQQATAMTGWGRETTSTLWYFLLHGVALKQLARWPSILCTMFDRMPAYCTHECPAIQKTQCSIPHHGSVPCRRTM